MTKRILNEAPGWLIIALAFVYIMYYLAQTNF